MAALTVILAPDGPTTGVYDVLVDLSAAGLVDPFLWVTAPPPGAACAAVAVENGRRRRTTVEKEVADDRDRPHDRVRLCVLVPLGAGTPVDMPTEERVAAAVTFAGGGQPVTRIRCVVARPGDTADWADVARDGWHNVLIAAEDAHGPGRNRLALGASDDPVDIGRYAAPAVAGVAALWTGVERSELDELTVPPERKVRAARGFYRRVDAQTVERNLRGRVLSTEPRLPLPRDDGAPALYLEDPGRATRSMFTALWAKHERLLVGARVTEDPGKAREIGALTALRWLFGFILAALRRRPEEWFRVKTAELASRAAKKLNEAIVGKRSAYQVVVRGMRADGMPAGLPDLDEASNELDDVLFALGEPGEQPAPVELTPLWKDFAGGAMTLLDAGSRGDPGMPPLAVGARRGVLRSVADCVPAGDDEFIDITPALSPHVEPTRIPAGDVLGADVLDRRLERLKSDAELALDAGRAQQALGSWRSRQEATYTGQLGRKIAERLRATLDDARSYLEQLRELADDEFSEEARRRQRALGRSMQFLVGFGTVAVVADLLLLGIGRLTPAIAALVAVSAVLLWLIASLISFVQGQRQIFRELTRRRARLTRFDALRLNLQQAVREMRRLSAAYEQYLLWSRVLGVVLREPFGRLPDEPPAGAAVARGLPWTTRTARALVAEMPMAEATAALRAELFVVGWLSGPWERQLASVAELLGVQGLELREHPENIYEINGPIEESALHAWAEALLRQGPPTEVGDGAWAGVVDALYDRRPELGTALLSSVQGLQEGEQRPVDLSTFMAGVDRGSAAGPSQEFTAEQFTVQARAAGQARVDFDDPTDARLGLSRVVVLVQFGPALPVWEFAAAVRTAGGGSTAPTVDPNDQITVPPSQDRF